MHAMFPCFTSLHINCAIFRIPACITLVHIPCSAGDALVCVVWEHHYPALARRLGIVYCFNRPCALHAVPVPRATSVPQTPEDLAAAGPRWITLTPSLQSAFSPQFAPSAAGGAPDTMVFLSQDAACESGVHSGTAAMYSLPWSQVRICRRCPDQRAPLLAPFEHNES